MGKENKISPTIECLDLKKDTENILGSSLTSRKRNLFGKEFYFYEDGSVLIFDPFSQEYHFITQEGREKGRIFRRSAKDVISGKTSLNETNFLGQGRFSRVYELNNSSGSLAVKVTDKESFAFKELAEKNAMEVQNSLAEFAGRGNRRKIVQRMALVDVVRLLRRLSQAEISTPEFYGFTVRKDATNAEIQEFQFMEKINAPTVASILQANLMIVEERDKNSASKFVIDPKFPYADFLAELSLKYFNNDLRSLIENLIISLRSFLIEVRLTILGIADLETDNIFVIGYDEESRQFRFMLIDPIEEEVLILPVGGKGCLSVISKEKNFLSVISKKEY